MGFLPFCIHNPNDEVEQVKKKKNRCLELDGTHKNHQVQLMTPQAIFQSLCLRTLLKLLLELLQDHCPWEALDNLLSEEPFPNILI